MIKVSYSMDWQSHVISFRIPDELYPAVTGKLECLCNHGHYNGLGVIQCHQSKENLALLAGVITDFIAGLPKCSA